jgi:hypothetical protein
MSAWHGGDAAGEPAETYACRRSMELSVAQAPAAALLNVSAPTVKRARVVERGAPELVAAVDQGRVSVRPPPPKFAKIGREDCGGSAREMPEPVSSLDRHNALIYKRYVRPARPTRAAKVLRKLVDCRFSAPPMFQGSPRPDAPSIVRNAG